MARSFAPALVYAHPSEGARVRDVAPERAFELGVGKVASAVALGRVLAEHRPPWVLAFGVCGVYPGAELVVGELCLVGRECLADEGVWTDQGLRSLSDLGLGPDELWLADAGRTQEIAARLGGLPTVTGATVSACAGTDDLALSRRERTGADVETMEGAAIAATCAAWGVPWVQLRCVGNQTGARDQAHFDLASASRRVQEAVLALERAGWA